MGADMEEAFNCFGSLASALFMLGVGGFYVWFYREHHARMRGAMRMAATHGYTAPGPEAWVDRGAVERHLRPLAERLGLTRRGVGWFAGERGGRLWAIGVGRPGAVRATEGYARGHELLLRVELQPPLGLGLAPGQPHPTLTGWLSEPELAWLTQSIGQAGGRGHVSDHAVEVTLEGLFPSHDATAHVLGWAAQLAEALEARAAALPPEARPHANDEATTGLPPVPARHEGRSVALVMADAGDPATAYLTLGALRPPSTRFVLHSNARGGVRAVAGTLYGSVVAQAWRVCPRAPTFFAGPAYEPRFVVQGAPPDAVYAALARPEVVDALARLDPIVTDIMRDDAGLSFALDRAPAPHELERLLAAQSRALAALER